MQSLFHCNKALQRVSIKTVALGFLTGMELAAKSRAPLEEQD
jgi:hypothetical protein